jgi:hypothetical protein
VGSKGAGIQQVPESSSDFPQVTQKIGGSQVQDSEPLDS